MEKLNIGCGGDIKKDFVNVDCVKLPGVDKVYNLNKYPWPFKDNEFVEVNAFMILEHLENWTKAMEEIYRITKNKGKIRITVPFFPSMYSVTDPTHKNFFTYLTMDYFQPNHPGNYNFNAKFNIVVKRITFSWNKILNIMSIPINLFPVFYARYLSFMLPSNEIYFELEVVK